MKLTRPEYVLMDKGPPMIVPLICMQSGSLEKGRADHRGETPA